MKQPFPQTLNILNMKKFLPILMLLLSVQIFAQDETTTPIDPGERAKIAQSVEALKIAFMTKELNLTTEEAQKFWPIYNGFSSELKKARVENKLDDIAFEEKKVVIMKKYKEDFKRVLNNDDRVRKCFRAEPEFHKLLRKEWARRQMNRPQHNGNFIPNKPSKQMEPHPKPNHPGMNKGGIRGPRG